MKTVFLSALFAFGVVGCGQVSISPKSSVHEKWNPQNDPLRLGNEYIRQFSSMPLEGEIAEQDRPWSETYWPSSEGGIAARWSGNKESGFYYELATLEQVKQMSAEQLRALSPAEKYDIYMGRFDYPTVQRERWRTSPDNEGWEGLCHGWAAASLLFREPKATFVKSANGIEIPFGSSDVKALLVYLQGEVSQARSSMLGERCNVKWDEEDRLNESACRDTNAGALQVVLANELGIKKKGFVFDRTRDFQVWNQPIFGFKSKVEGTQNPSEGAAPGTVQEVLLSTEIFFALENSPHWEPVLGTDHQNDSSETYRYRIELNAQGEIIGGAWLDWNRPDFLWKQNKAKFEGYFKGLEAIAKAAGI